MRQTKTRTTAINQGKAIDSTINLLIFWTKNIPVFYFLFTHVGSYWLKNRKYPKKKRTGVFWHLMRTPNQRPISVEYSKHSMKVERMSLRMRQHPSTGQSIAFGLGFGSGGTCWPRSNNWVHALNGAYGIASASYNQVNNPNPAVK